MLKNTKDLIKKNFFPIPLAGSDLYTTCKRNKTWESFSPIALKLRDYFA